MAGGCQHETCPKVDLAKMKAKRLHDEYEQKQRAYQDLRAETLKVIQGNSRFSADLLNSLMTLISRGTYPAHSARAKISPALLRLRPFSSGSR